MSVYTSQENQSSRQAGYGPEAIFNELKSVGFSAVAAVGVLANALAESQLDPEASASDPTSADPGAMSYGLWQFNTGTYPDAKSLVTGDPVKDMQAQVAFLANNGGIKAASGTTYTETAGNFASGFERCATCSPGGASYQQRVGYANQVAQWASSGDWPADNDLAVDQATIGGGGGPGNAADCAWHVAWGGVLGVGGFNACIISKSELRGLAGVGLLLGGAFVGLIGIQAAAIVIGLEVVGMGVLGKLTGGAGRAAAGAARVTRSSQELAA